MKCPRCGGRLVQLEELTCINCARVVAPRPEHREPVYITGDPPDKAGRNRRAQHRYTSRRAGG